MNEKLIKEALAQLAKKPGTAAVLSLPKTDEIGHVVSELSKFLRNAEDPRQPSLALQFLQTQKAQILIGYTERGGSCFLDGNGTWRQEKGKNPEQICFREAIEVFCATIEKGRQHEPTDLIPYLEGKITELAMRTIATERQAEFDPA